MADGSIIIDTRIDTGGVSKGMNAVKAGMARISAQVSKMGDSAKSSFQRQITAITGLYQNYEKQERKVSELKSKLEELSKVRIETEEYKKLKDDIKALEDEFEKVETKQREWLDMGFSIDSAPLQELDKQMDDIWADIDRLQRKQKEIQTTGRAYVDPTSTDAYKSTAEKCNVESQKLEHINGRLYSSYNKLKNKVEEYRQKNSRLVQVMQNLQKAAARVGMVVKNMGSALRRAGSAIKSMVSAMKRVNTVPYLAKGAVIPPRSEFLAVLGDQKQGNNIETPEALLRKIVREETAGRQTGGGSYRFTAQINRRTLFDEMMKEAQMRRDTSGRNPFEMA